MRLLSKKGIIPILKPILDALRTHGARIGQPLSRLALASADEAMDA